MAPFGFKGHYLCTLSHPLIQKTCTPKWLSKDSFLSEILRKSNVVLRYTGGFDKMFLGVTLREKRKQGYSVQKNRGSLGPLLAMASLNH